MTNKAKLFPYDSDTVALWNLDGKLKDESENGFDLSVDTGTEQYGIGPVCNRKAGLFDGSTILARGGADSNLNILGDVTIEALIFLTAIPATNADIVAMSNDPDATEANNSAWWLGVVPSTNQVRVRWIHEYSTGNNQSNTWSDVSLPLHRWVYLAAVRDDTAKTVTLYINGAANPNPYSYSNSPTGGTAARASIGGLWATDANIFSGLIGSVRVSNIARTPTEIKEMSNRVLARRGFNIKIPDKLPERSPGLHSNIKVWHRADNNDDENGDQVQTPTLLGGANGLAMGNESIRPLMHTSAGHASWKMYDGASAFYFSGAALSNYIDSTPAFQAFCAFVLDDVNLDESNLIDNHRIFGDDNGAWGVYARRSGSIATEVYGLLNDGAVKTTIHSGVSLGEPHLIEFWYDGNGLMVSRLDDGPQVETAVSAISEVTAPLELGGQDVLSGSILEFLCASLTGSALEVSGTRNYFKNRYGMDV